MISEIAGETLSVEKRLSIITKLDADSDGGISIAEFYKAMEELPGISSLNDHVVSGLMSAQFTLQVGVLFVHLVLLQSVFMTNGIAHDALTRSTSPSDCSRTTATTCILMPTCSNLMPKSTLK